MKRAIIFLMTLTSIIAVIALKAQAWDQGNAPWCLEDRAGNLQCFYYDKSSCVYAAISQGKDCVKNTK